MTSFFKIFSCFECLVFFSLLSFFQNLGGSDHLVIGVGSSWTKAPSWQNSSGKKLLLIFPSPQPALQLANQSGFRRIVIFSVSFFRIVVFFPYQPRTRSWAITTSCFDNNGLAGNNKSFNWGSLVSFPGMLSMRSDESCIWTFMRRNSLGNSCSNSKLQWNTEDRALCLLSPWLIT